MVDNVKDHSSGGRRIFGLGLSKTGTSSLTDALNLLGVKAVHYPHDERTYNELRSGNYRLTILEDYEAIADIPVAPYFAQLDAEFPGSKFILTVREKEAWLRSCELHWRLMMEWWSKFPRFRKFHEFISAVVYGTIQFNRSRFAYIYETHVRNVSEYFSDRPGDLLVLDVCGGEGWEKLCGFLGVPAPDVPFPRANEWMHLLMRAAEEVAEVVPAGATFILVDEQGFGSDFARERESIPFLERDGAYWGAPPDAETAISELERLRTEADARFIVFGWPAFWWLSHYVGLHEYLGSNFRCSLENERLVIFDLR